MCALLFDAKAFTAMRSLLGDGIYLTTLRRRKRRELASMPELGRKVRLFANQDKSYKPSWDGRFRVMIVFAALQDWGLENDSRDLLFFQNFQPHQIVIGFFIKPGRYIDGFLQIIVCRGVIAIHHRNIAGVIICFGR